MGSRVFRTGSPGTPCASFIFPEILRGSRPTGDGGSAPFPPHEAPLTKVKARISKVMFTFPCLTNATENMT